MIFARTVVDPTLADELRAACMTVALNFGGWNNSNRTGRQPARRKAQRRA